MEVLIIGFVSGLTITMGGLLVCLQMNCRMNHMAQQIENLEGRVQQQSQQRQSPQQRQPQPLVQQQQVQEWRSVPTQATTVFYPEAPKPSAPPYLG